MKIKKIIIFLISTIIFFFINVAYAATDQNVNSDNTDTSSSSNASSSVSNADSSGEANTPDDSDDVVIPDDSEDDSSVLPPCDQESNESAVD